MKSALLNSILLILLSLILTETCQSLSPAIFLMIPRWCDHWFYEIWSRSEWTSETIYTFNIIKTIPVELAADLLTKPELFNRIWSVLRPEDLFCVPWTLPFNSAVYYKSIQSLCAFCIWTVLLLCWSMIIRSWNFPKCDDLWQN